MQENKQLIEKQREYVRQVCELYKLAPSTLATKADLSPSTLNRFFDEDWQGALSHRTIAKIEKFSGLNYGAPVVPTNSESSSATTSGVSEPLARDYRIKPKPLDPDFIRIGYYNAEISCGPGRFIDEEAIVDGLSFKREWLRAKTNAPFDKLKIVSIMGDSMEPTISDGDHALIDMTQTMPKSDGVYVMWYDGGAIAKRVSIDVPRRKIKLTSDNPKYPTIEVYDADELYVTGRVLWRGGNV